MGENSAHENTYIETLHSTHTVRATPSYVPSAYCSLEKDVACRYHIHGELAQERGPYAHCSLDKGVAITWGGGGMGTHVQTGLQGLEVMPNTLFLRIQPVEVLEKIEGVARAVSCSSHEGSADARAVLRTYPNR